MSVIEVLEKMVKGHSWISICQTMESKGMSRQEINNKIDEAKRMKAFLDMN